MALSACGGPDDGAADPAEDGPATPDTTPADESAARGGPPPQPVPDTGTVARDTAASEWTVGIIDQPRPTPGTVPAGVPVLTGIAFEGAPDVRRVTLELGEGGAAPGYHLEYVDRPLHECGSGRQIHPVGEAWLQIRLSPAAAHTEAGESTLPANEIPVEEVDGLLRAYRTCDFEGVVTLVLALESPAPFRVRSLEGGRRLIVEIQR